MTIELI